jgi:hypothetical protein
MSVNKLEALKSAFDKKASSTGGDQSWKLFYSFWKMPDDTQAIVRFLPDLDENNNLGFLVENLTHELVINGQKKKVPCLAMHGEDCPICNLARKYYDEKNETMGKKYYRKKSYIGQVIVVESPIEHDQTQLVKLIEFGPAVFTQIQAAFQSGDLEEAPFELVGGYNFRIKKTKSGQYASYATSSFAPKQTNLEDDVISQLKLFNLADYRGKAYDLATVEAMLLADQTGKTFADDKAGEDTPAPQTPAATPKASAPAATPKEEAAPAETPKDESAAPSKGASVLEQLRARAKAAAAESSDE